MTTERMTKVQMRLLFQTLDINTSLRDISLVRSDLTDEDVEDLFEALKQNDTLVKLELDENRIGTYAILQLAELITENKGIKHLSLEGNAMSKEAATALINSLANNKTLMYLNLSNCDLDSECLTMLIDIVSNNSNLVMVDIDGNTELNFKIIRMLQIALQKNKNRLDNEKQFEWEERRLLDEHDSNLRQINEVKAKKLEMLESIKLVSRDRQEWRQKLIGEELEKQKVEDYRTAKRLEKEMMIRALKKKRTAKPKNIY